MMVSVNNLHMLREFNQNDVITCLTQATTESGFKSAFASLNLAKFFHIWTKMIDDRVKNDSFSDECS